MYVPIVVEDIVIEEDLCQLDDRGNGDVLRFRCRHRSILKLMRSQMIGEEMRQRADHGRMGDHRMEIRQGESDEESRRTETMLWFLTPMIEPVYKVSVAAQRSAVHGTIDDWL